MATVETKYQFTTARENVIEKDWAAGSSKIVESSEYVITLNKKGSGPRYAAQYKKVSYAPAWLKIVDEPIVNALDHLIRCMSKPNPTDRVTWIKVSYEQTGRVKISNNGPGIEIEVHKVASEKLGRETWVPDFIFGELFQGSNRTKSDDSIIGGTNGLGAKLSNCFSTEFIVETVSHTPTSKALYIQRWRNKMADREAPKIVDLSAPSKLPLERTLPHTTLSFVPDYQHFGYDQFTAEIYNELVDIVRTRVFLAAAYAKYASVGLGGGQNIDIYFNDEKVEINGMADIAAILFPGRPCIRTTITPVMDPKAKSRLSYRYPWEVCAVVLSNDDESGPAINQMSNVNGVVVRDGKHTKHIFTKIIDGVKEKIMKIFKDKNMTFKTSYVTNNIFVLANTMIPNPGWTGQRKDVLELDIRKLAGYTLDKKFIDGISDKLKDLIVDEVFNEKEQKVSKKKDADIEYDKYTPAHNCDSRKAETRLKCNLLAFEGDSAMSQGRTGITNNPNMGFDYYGVICLGGVIMNARKECAVIETSDGSRKVRKSTKLINNVFLNALLSVTGLNMNHKYDPQSPTYKKEMSELKYGCITACVDQDYDGVGNIFALLLNIFELFWPNLLAAGYIKRFDTPKIRAYPKKGGKIMEFYTDDEYDQWAKSLEVSGKSTSSWNIKYYKGLGTHSRDETIHMFKNFQKHLFTYYLDAKSHDMFEIYYGSDPDLRKVALATPTVVPSPDKVRQQVETMLISCSDHLDYETKTFQKDSIERHLDHALDGFNQSGRMIFDGAQKAFRSRDDEMKVAQLAGYISEHENYHHGEASLAESITGRAFITVGGKQIPQLLPYGQFGSRLCGGKNAAKPRYIWTKLNKRAMDIIYPEPDYWMLEFTFDEGERGAPKYYLPIIPTSILESTELPGHGWKIKTWGRDALKVIENVRRLIRIDDAAKLLVMPAYTHGWKGKIQTIRGEPYSFGIYEHDEKNNSIKITELPLRVWTIDYVAKLRKKITETKIGADGKKVVTEGRVIQSIVDASDDRAVKIEVKLKPGAMEWLQANGWGDSAFTDPVEEYFMLRDHMDSNLNMIGSRGEVIEFKSYEDILTYWFPFRKMMYIKRVDRQAIILKLKIMYYANLVRYINECIELRIVKMKVKDMEHKLATIDPPYDRIHRGKIMNPKFTPTEKLEELALHGPKANYDYLLDLTDREKSEESLAKFTRELDENRKQLAELEEKMARGRFRGAYIWEEELDQLEEVIKEGRNTDWMFGEKGKYEFM